MFDLQPIGAKIIGAYTVSADNDGVAIPAPAATVNLYRKIVLAVLHDNTVNPVYGCVAGETGETAVKIEPHADKHQLWGPFDVTEFPSLRIRCSVATDVDVTVLGFEEGEPEEFICC